MSEICADCGEPVELRRGRWGKRIKSIFGDGPAWDFCCRWVRQGDKLVKADFHYVAGETQRHFPE